MSSLFDITLAYLSKICGLDTVSTFPADHIFARTQWNPAYFDISSNMTPDQIERTLCQAISNTPSIFSHISNPTPRMQRSLLTAVNDSMRRKEGNTGELIAMLINAYTSRYVLDAVPGLRAEIMACAGLARADQIRQVMRFLMDMAAPLGVIEEH